MQGATSGTSRSGTTRSGPPSTGLPTDDLPPGIPRSPTGRVPAWVLAEATGVTPDAGTSPRSWEPPPPVPHRRRLRSWLVAAAVLGVVGAVGWALVRPVGTTPVADGPPVATAPRLGEPGASYAFRATDPQTGAPVTFDPCTTELRYVVRPDGAPPDGDAIIAEALAEVSRATGFVFVPEGSTTEGPRPLGPERVSGTADPILVVWSTAEESSHLAGGVAGWATSNPVSLPLGPARYRTGQVVLDADDLGRFLQAPGGRALVRGVVVHEVAHVLGLDHVDDPTQLMNPEGSGLAELQAGDLLGLRAVGTGGCGG